jgi:DnaJ-class molecular chaperone
MAPRARFDKDYYGTIGLHPEATDDEIRRAYRRLALEWHPDRRPGDPTAAERFKEISEAYAVLIDPARRRDYDASRRAGAPGEFRPNRDDLFRDLFANARASAIFEELTREFERIGMRVDRQYFHRTLFGGRGTVTGGVFVITPLTPLLAVMRLARALAGPASHTRQDSGRPRPLPESSGVLGALGRWGRWLFGLPAPAALPGSEDLVLPLRLSPTEAANGGRRRVTLDVRGGAGDVLVTIPPGVRTGTRLRLRGRGRPRAGGSRGDVYLAVEIAEHP